MIGQFHAGDTRPRAWPAACGKANDPLTETRSPRKPAPADRPVSQTVGRYLEAIFYIDTEERQVRAARLAEWLGVSQPTAGATLKRMLADGLIEISPSKVLSLTQRGRQAAERIVRKHRIAERWLTDVLGFDWLQADEEASKLEHALSDDVADRLHALIGRPSTCPHGNPIPGAKGTRRRERPLSSLQPGQRSLVQRISEVAEHEVPELLRFLSAHGISIGTQVETVSINSGAGTQIVRVGAGEIPLSLEVAGKIWIDA
jgi:DtxR family Mn-dependent transcriptional regulator